MTNYAVTSVKSATNDGVIVDVVNFNEGVTQVEVLNRSNTATLWIRADGVDPTVGGDDSYPVPPLSVRTLESPFEYDLVKIIADAAADFTAAGIS